MAKFQVVLSEDAATIVIRGDRRRPEPTYAIIQFPGGSVEVSRHSEGGYWIHIARQPKRKAWEGEPAGRIIESRIDYEEQARGAVRLEDLPDGELIEHIAARIVSP